MKLFVTALVTLFTLTNVLAQEFGPRIITADDLDNAITGTKLKVDGKSLDAQTIDIPFADKKSAMKHFEEMLEEMEGDKGSFKTQGNTIKCTNCSLNNGADALDIILQVEKNKDGGVRVSQALTLAPGGSDNDVEKAQEQVLDYLVGHAAEVQLEAIEDKYEDAEDDLDDAQDDLDDIKKEIKKLEEDLLDGQKEVKEKEVEVMQLKKMKKDAEVATKELRVRN